MRQGGQFLSSLHFTIGFMSGVYKLLGGETDGETKSGCRCLHSDQKANV